MSKIALFDVDGVLNHAERFSTRYAEKFGIDVEQMLPFFKNEFQLCLVGKADLKEQLELIKDQWGYPGSVDELLNFWFAGEVNVNSEVLAIIKAIRTRGYKVVAATNQEAYRTQYLQETLHLEQIFAKTFSSAFVGHKKPEKEFYEAIAQELNVPFSDMVYWDDDQENIDQAKLLGMGAYLFVSPEKLLEQAQKEFGTL